MGSQWVPPVFHLAAVLHYLWIEYYFEHYMIIPNVGPLSIFHGFGGRFKFLTIWNMFFQTFFFAICLVNDIFGTNETNVQQKPIIRKARDFLHASIGLPLSLFVASSFWSLWFIDRELVFPVALDAYFPFWMNQSMHTIIIALSLVQTWICYHSYPSKSVGVTTLATLAFIYVSGLFAVYLFKGVWVYPVFSSLSWIERIGFLAVAVTYLCSLYFVGEYVNSKIWKKEIKMVVPGRLKKEA